MPAGPVALITHSGSVFSAMLRARRGFGFSVVVSSGQELVTTAAAYARYERAHVADLAAELNVPFAPLSPATTQRLAATIDPGHQPGNPLDVWATGRDTEPLFAECLAALAADPQVAAVALAVDLVPELDGDEAYPRAVLTAAANTAKPVAVLAGLPAAVDPVAASRLRASGVPVLEGTRTGLLALRHLLDHADRPEPPAPATPGPRRRRWAPVLSAGPPGTAVLFDLLRDYGIPAVRARAAGTRAGALAAAAEIGYPVVLKTDEPAIAHKSDVGGVRLGLAGPEAAGAAYDDLATRLGPRVLVCQTAAPGTELALGLVRDAALGPLLIVSAGGVLIEIFSERSVVLPPVTRSSARVVVARLRLAAVLAGARGQPPADLDAIADAIAGLSELAAALGDLLAALDINPLICGPSGAVAADVLAVTR